MKAIGSYKRKSELVSQLRTKFLVEDLTVNENSIDITYHGVDMIKASKKQLHARLRQWADANPTTQESNLAKFFREKNEVVCC